jgi:MFS family permease
MRNAKAAFCLRASVILFFLAGSTAPTPLYAVYQAAWGFSPITITVIFAIYALAVLGTLLVVGSLSDYVGRRPVVLVATLLQAVAMTIFATAHGVPALLFARVVQGIATGGAVGAAGAGMLDFDRERGAVVNSVSPMIGLATGGLVSGLLVQFLPAPTRLIYIVLGTIFVAQAVLTAVLPDSVAPRPGALASLRPNFRIPPRVRRPMLFAIPAIVASWALAGFYGSLAPSLVRALVGFSSPARSGLALCLFASAGAVTVLLTLSKGARVLMTLGTASLIVGVGLTLLAVQDRSVAGSLVGTVVAGAGFGAAFQGAMRSVLPLVAAHERAGVLSVLYLAAYLALGLPAVLGGVGVVYGGGLFATAREYGVGVALLAAMALAGTFAHSPQSGVASIRRSPLASEK